MTERMNYAKASGAAMRALNGVHAYIADCGLPKQLVDLVFLRVSQINGCAYCIDMHSRDLLKENLPVEKLVLVPVWREARTVFSAQERAALAWAETVTNVAETNVPDSEYAEVSPHFSDKELVDLTVAIGLMNAFNRLAISFRAVPESAKIAKH